MSSIFSNVFSKYDASIQQLEENITKYDVSMTKLHEYLDLSLENEDFSYNVYQSSDTTISTMNTFLADLTESSNEIHDNIVSDISNTDFSEHAEFLNSQYEEVDEKISEYNSKVDKYNMIQNQIFTNEQSETDTMVFRNYMLMITWFFIACIILIIALLSIYEDRNVVKIYTKIAFIFITIYVMYMLYKYYTMQHTTSDAKKKVQIIIHRKKKSEHEKDDSEDE